jgi:hypothetical protein
MRLEIPNPALAGVEEHVTTPLGNVKERVFDVVLSQVADHIPDRLYFFVAEIFKLTRTLRSPK